MENGVRASWMKANSSAQEVFVKVLFFWPNLCCSGLEGSDFD